MTRLNRCSVGQVREKPIVSNEDGRTSVNEHKRPCVWLAHSARDIPPNTSINLLCDLSACSLPEFSAGRWAFVGWWEERANATFTLLVCYSNVFSPASISTRIIRLQRLVIDNFNERKGHMAPASTCQTSTSVAAAAALINRSRSGSSWIAHRLTIRLEHRNRISEGETERREWWTSWSRLVQWKHTRYASCFVLSDEWQLLFDGVNLRRMLVWRHCLELYRRANPIKHHTILTSPHSTLHASK